MFLRTLVVALMLLCQGLPGLAHGFPGSTLTLSPRSDRLSLTLALPLEELILARPEFAGLRDLPREQPLPPDAQAALSAYLLAHIALVPDGAPALPLALTGARLEIAADDDVGLYDVLTVDLAAGPARFPLTLRFDAILHQVRSHQALVLLAIPGQSPRPLGKIRHDAALGRAPDLVLTLPP